MQGKKVIPIFYASDENYIPYLAVSLFSLKAHKSKGQNYKIHILYTGAQGENVAKIKGMAEEEFSIEFIDVAKELRLISDCMVCRDYYTPAIFYRLLIPQLFPGYDKALYLDCDTVALADVSELYNIDIQDKYIGAVADQAVAAVDAFRLYVKNALDIEPEKYFNSGVIVLNLNELRKINFYQTFYSILDSYDFTVAPDQDCLNLICKDRVYYYGAEWNKMPTGGLNGETPKLIHYNLAMKPWHYDGVLFEDYFWEYAKQTPFYNTILAEKQAFTPQMAMRDKIGGEKLLALASSEAENPDNYIRTVRKKESK